VWTEREEVGAMGNVGVPKDAVRRIVADLSGRHGLDGAWDSIDERIQQEIIREWERIIEGEINQWLLSAGF
jgi:hypothetical protein